MSLTSYHSSILDINHQKRYYNYFYQLGNIDECIKILQNLVKGKIPDETVDTLISKTKQSFKTVVKNHTKGREFDGIIKYLTEKTGSNIHDNGTIEATSNSIQEELYRVVDHQCDAAYCSKDDGGAILCFDFKNRRINLTSYSMLSWGNSYGTWQLKNWVIEVSDDGKKWIEIDRHENDETLKKNYFTATFNIKNPSNEFKRFLRLRQTGNGWDPSGNHNVVGFNKIEFYGTLQEP